ncbi:ABC transporter ATP-binding protein [candidate division KSB1 bacterium]|nr:ABC transporter ATP-binding protein [candidate division KSB1 bacterium]
MIVLKVKNIAKQFKMGDKTIQVLKDVNFSLRRGEIASILGVSGAGKSTLLSIIGTLDRPSGGTVILEDKNITSFNENQLCELRNRKIGFVFQFHYLLPEFTALENVAMPGLIQRLPRKIVFEKAESLLSEVGLSDRAEHKPNELSGGELQRVAVARSLVNDPVLVLADEPTGNLDRENGDAVYALMLKLSRDSGKTFLVVTHNETIAKRTDRVLTLADGVMI